MLAAVKIKEEPLDEAENSQEIFKQEEALLNQQINDEALLGINNFHIVEEKDTIITVNAAEMRSEDEKRFIDSLNNADLNKFKGICSKCLKPFTNRAQFLKHTRRNHCVTKQWCPVCPVTFVDTSSMLNHLNLHRENQFFCSHQCGASYETLPLCEDHELKEHKIQATPKRRFRHFCSFCRVGFKTELQLHVHWLQQTVGCGKKMQDVVLHSANLTNMYKDDDVKTSSSLLLDKQANTQTLNSASTIPITKLRLKYDVSATNKKRQTTTDNEDINRKRLKLPEDKNTEMDFFNFETDIKIKEEPVDDYEGTITSNLIPEVIIKTEEEEVTEPRKEVSQKPAMKSVIINNNMIGPESSGKFIPLEQLVSNENNKSEATKIPNILINTVSNSNATHSIKNNNATDATTKSMPVLKVANNNASSIVNNNNPNSLIKNPEGSLRLFKIAPVSSIASNNHFTNFNTAKLTSIKLANGQNLNNADIKPLPKSGLQILKLLPNTQIMSMSKKPNPNNNSNSLLVNNNKSPLVLKLKNSSTSPTQMANQTPPALVPIFVAKAPPTPSNSNSTSSSKAVSIKLNSLDQNTTIDAEDFKKLQAEALIKAEEHRKNFYIPKTRLMIIENIPEKKQLIDNMKQKIAEVKDKTTEQIQGKPGGKFILNTKNSEDPPSLYLPILPAMDVELVQARYQHPNYNYKWICPYCMKDYEIKTALKMHLVKAHNLTTRDMEKINVQARPYKIEVVDDPIGEIEIEIKEESMDNDTDSQSQATSETESYTASQLQKQVAALKFQRQRYVCEKCGRTCSSKTMLNDHILANCSREPQYSCQQCPKKFFSHGTLQCHMSIHTGEMPHKCNYCDKRFRTRGQVKVHHRTHTGERPFFCQVCSQRFTHRETLIAHLSRHIGMKRYKCYGCDKHFSCISALKTHREIRADTCGKVKFNPRAIGPRVRVIRGNVIFEPQPEINPYLKSEDPKCVLSELQNQSDDTKSMLSELKHQSEDSKSVIFEIKKTA